MEDVVVAQRSEADGQSNGNDRSDEMRKRQGRMVQAANSLRNHLAKVSAPLWNISTHAMPGKVRGSSPSEPQDTCVL